MLNRKNLNSPSHLTSGGKGCKWTDLIQHRKGLLLTSFDKRQKGTENNELWEELHSLSTQDLAALS